MFSGWNAVIEKEESKPNISWIDLVLVDLIAGMKEVEAREETELIRSMDCSSDVDDVDDVDGGRSKDKNEESSNDKRRSYFYPGHPSQVLSSIFGGGALFVNLF